MVTPCALLDTWLMKVGVFDLARLYTRLPTPSRAGRSGVQDGDGKKRVSFGVSVSRKSHGYFCVSCAPWQCMRMGRAC